MTESINTPQNKSLKQDFSNEQEVVTYSITNFNNLLKSKGYLISTAKLRRLDNMGKFMARRFEGSDYRFYTDEDVNFFIENFPEYQESYVNQLKADKERKRLEQREQAIAKEKAKQEKKGIRFKTTTLNKALIRERETNNPLSTANSANSLDIPNLSTQTQVYEKIINSLLDTVTTLSKSNLNTNIHQPLQGSDSLAVNELTSFLKTFAQNQAEQAQRQESLLTKINDNLIALQADIKNIPATTHYQNEVLSDEYCIPSSELSRYSLTLNTKEQSFTPQAQTNANLLSGDMANLDNLNHDLGEAIKQTQGQAHIGDSEKKNLTSLTSEPTGKSSALNAEKGADKADNFAELSDFPIPYDYLKTKATNEYSLVEHCFGNPIFLKARQQGTSVYKTDNEIIAIYKLFHGFNLDESFFLNTLLRYPIKRILESYLAYASYSKKEQVHNVRAYLKKSLEHNYKPKFLDHAIRKYLDFQPILQGQPNNGEIYTLNHLLDFQEQSKITQQEIQAMKQSMKSVEMKLMQPAKEPEPTIIQEAQEQPQKPPLFTLETQAGVNTHQDSPAPNTSANTSNQTILDTDSDLAYYQAQADMDMYLNQEPLEYDNLEQEYYNYQGNNQELPDYLLNAPTFYDDNVIEITLQTPYEHITKEQTLPETLSENHPTVNVNEQPEIAPIAPPANTFVSTQYRPNEIASDFEKETNTMLEQEQRLQAEKIRQSTQSQAQSSELESQAPEQSYLKIKNAVILDGNTNGFIINQDSMKKVIARTPVIRNGKGELNVSFGNHFKCDTPTYIIKWLNHKINESFKLETPYLTDNECKFLLSIIEKHILKPRFLIEYELLEIDSIFRKTARQRAMRIHGVTEHTYPKTATSFERTRYFSKHPYLPIDLNEQDHLIRSLQTNYSTYNTSIDYDIGQTDRILFKQSESYAIPHLIENITTFILSLSVEQSKQLIGELAKTQSDWGVSGVLDFYYLDDDKVYMVNPLQLKKLIQNQFERVTGTETYHAYNCLTRLWSVVCKKAKAMFDLILPLPEIFEEEDDFGAIEFMIENSLPQPTVLEIQNYGAFLADHDLQGTNSLVYRMLKMQKNKSKKLLEQVNSDVAKRFDEIKGSVDTSQVLQDNDYQSKLKRQNPTKTSEQVQTLEIENTNTPAETAEIQTKEITPAPKKPLPAYNPMTDDIKDKERQEQAQAQLQQGINNVIQKITSNIRPSL